MSASDKDDPLYDFVSPEKLKFDQDNPRFGGDLTKKDQESIQLSLMGKPHYASELVDSLLENGFIPYEPLVVRKIGGGYVVIEGNRRLAAVKHILAEEHKYAATEKIASLKKIPVLIFQEKNQTEAERTYLGVRHLFGFREWPPLSKAKFLDKAIKTSKDLDVVVRELGVTKQEIKRYLVPYRLLLSIHTPIPESEDFWVLGEALSRGGIKEYLQLEFERDSLKLLNVDGPKVDLLLNFIYGQYDKKKKTRDPATRRISDTRQLKDLATVLGSDRARVALEKGAPLDEALLYVETKEQSIRRLQRLISQLDKLLKEGLKLKISNPDDTALIKAFSDFAKKGSEYIRNAERNI